MKRLISAITAIALVIGMLIPISLSAAANLLSDGGFESGAISEDSKWKFSSVGQWYGGATLRLPKKT